MSRPSPISSIHFKMWTLQVLSHLGFAVAIWQGAWGWWCAGLGVFAVKQIFGANIGLHRYCAHRSFTTSKWKDRVLVVLSNMCGMGSTIAWVTVHRHHHLNTDMDSDCHSPQNLSIFQILTSQWKPATVRARSDRDLWNSKLHLFFHQYYMWIHLAWFTFLLLIDWRLAVFLYCVPALLIFYSSFAVVILCHLGGYKNFASNDHAHNNIWASIFTLGEGWHNNHHHRPSAWDQSVRAFEIDPNAWMIRLFFKPVVVEKDE